VVKQGIRIGSNVIIGAGTIVIKDIGNEEKVVGNPQRNI
jgi:acetyltransferase-like isoleucine patch superfamily enzyme